MYVGGDACVKIEKVKTKTIYKMLRGNKVRRPTSEGVWERVYNNLIVSKFDVTVKRECDVCKLKYGMSSEDLEQNIQMAYAYLDKDIFLESFVEGCALVDVNDNGNLVYAYDGVG
ncbi:hypothetical protein F7725_024453 [Dissostichus mawsoni]|uniref:Uncharacterized protein n=1 Tax=Dissostichus mawsoni TaxID=36200 RepID=A0A7J5XZG6_DISMA|nr:hypothetical protein F7725_024453 [Dissostichus mawsoni]